MEGREGGSLIFALAFNCVVWKVCLKGGASHLRAEEEDALQEKAGKEKTSCWYLLLLLLSSLF